ncbi:hypothetical protein [Risungbinella massiliensis]|uniref:hypothetical protein n=1 Tax=Risungbinella massiliensis TaxID=1329796 RepID=UPI0005CBF3F2|nr:hypothetical protein [Risungbinella massiliensis]
MKLENKNDTYICTLCGDVFWDFDNKAKETGCQSDYCNGDFEDLKIYEEGDEERIAEAHRG